MGLSSQDRSGAGAKNDRYGLPCTLLNIFFTVGSYFLLMFDVVRSVNILPSRDNMMFFFFNYKYYANSLLYGFGFPAWYPAQGGTPIAATSLTFSPFVPHRVLGYALYLLLPTDPMTLYKTTLVLGMAVTGAAWWLCLYKLVKSRAGATFGSLMLLLGGTGITVLHQEQILFTMSWTPWALLALLYARDDLRFLIVAAVMYGFAMTVHYPQIHIISSLFLLAALFLGGVSGRSLVKTALERKAVMLASLLLFLLAASPLIFVYKTSRDFSSPLRQTEEMEIASYDDYIRLNTTSGASAYEIGHFMNYISPRTEVTVDKDRLAFFAGTAGVIFAALGLILRGRAALPALIALLLFGWATIGINGYLPQLLYVLRFPFVKYFRQWYHFMPYLNLSLSVLGALGFAAVWDFFFVRLLGAAKVIRAVSLALLAIVVFGGLFYQGRGYLGAYADKHLLKGGELPRPGKAEFLGQLSTTQYRYSFDKSFVVYREWGRLHRLCPDVLNRPFAVSTVYNDESALFYASDEVLKGFCASGLTGSSVLALIPSASPRFSGLNVIHVKEGPGYFSRNGEVPEEAAAFPPSSFMVTPKGALLSGMNQGASFGVFPFAYKLNLTARLNGETVETYPVYGGAMTGVLLPDGEYRLELGVPFSAYEAALLIQAALFVFAAAFLIFLKFRPSGPSGA